MANRPKEVAQCLATIERTGVALITGPSGIGKSAVAYLTARSTRDLIRWIRVGAPGSVFDLIKFAQALRASRHAPVGFLLDDIGRISASMWDDLVRMSREHEGVLVLGTTRDEDLDLLAEAPESFVVRPQLDDCLAETIWTHLVAEGKTKTVSWIEAFEHSNGLTLEYVHYLTTGARLPETIAQQVKRRRKERRDSELQLLRIVSVAASAGAVVDLRRFATESNLSDEDVQRTVLRLVDEHLVQATNNNGVAGLHRLRSQALVTATHSPGPPSLAETAASARRCVSIPDLPMLTGELFTQGHLELSAVYEALTHRLYDSPTPNTLAQSLNGLRIAALRQHVEQGKKVLDDGDLPPGLWHMAVRLAMVEDNGLLDTLSPRFATTLVRLRGLEHDEFRSSWLSQLPSELLERSISCRTTDEGIAVLHELAGLSTAADLGTAIVRGTPQSDDIESTAQFINAARLISADTALAAVESVGGEHRLIVFATAQPWVSHVTIQDQSTSKGGSSRCLEFHLLCIEGGLPSDPHDSVVDLCRLFLRLFPDLSLVAGKAVDVTGDIFRSAGTDIADKKIPRKNLPSQPEIRWNRELLNGFAEAGTESRTERLAAESALLDRSLDITLELANRWFNRQSASSNHLVELEAIAESAQCVWKREYIGTDFAAVEVRQPDIGDLANALQQLCGNALPRLFKSADMRLAGFLGDSLRKALLKTVDVGYWRLLGADHDDKVLQLVSTVDQVHTLLGLRIHEENGGAIAWEARPSSISVAQAAQAADEAHASRLDAAVGDALKSIRALGFRAEAVRIEQDGVSPLIWPTDDVMITVEVHLLFAWLGATAPILEASTKHFKQLRRVIILPKRNGSLVPTLAVRNLTTQDGIPFPAVDEAEQFCREHNSPTLTSEIVPAVIQALALEASIEAIARLETHRPLHIVEADSLDVIKATHATCVDSVEQAARRDQTGSLTELLGTFINQIESLTASEAVRALTEGTNDELRDILACIHATEMELAVDPVSTRSELERLIQPSSSDGVNAVIAALPGIPPDCFDAIERVIGLRERLDGCTHIDAFNAVIQDFVGADSVPSVVAEHVLVWNQLKAESATYSDDYAAFMTANAHRWLDAGLETSPPAQTIASDPTKVGRNEPCPCGSGRKCKKCHLQ